MRRLLPLLALAAVVTGCKNPEKPLLEVPEDRSWTLPTLQDNAHIVFTEGNVPHIYAENRRDLAVVWGFQVARDRFFMMDLSRRLALGELSEVLGEDALSADMESRAEGNRHIAEQMLVLIETHHPELLELVDAYAEGVNAYLAAVRAERLPPPSEYDFAATTLGAESAIDLMTDFDRLDVIAGAATVIAQSGFESGDVRRGYTVSQLADWYAGADHEDLRQAGVRADIWDRVEPTFDVASASPAIDGTGTAIDVTTVTGTRNNAQSGHTFMISFYGSNGHTIPTILSSGFENGATDSFSYDTGDLGDFCE